MINTDGMNDNTRLVLTQEAADLLEIPRKATAKQIRDAISKLERLEDSFDDELTEF